MANADTDVPLSDVEALAIDMALADVGLNFSADNLCKPARLTELFTGYIRLRCSETTLLCCFRS